jgi:hypothetical protein
MPPPALPIRVQLGVPSASSPPRYIPGSPSIVQFFAARIPQQITLVELVQRMSSYSGCLTHTLKSRPSTIYPNTSEFIVHFISRAHAEQCAVALQGRPFSDAHPDVGNISIKIKSPNEIQVPIAVPIAPHVPQRPTKPLPAPVMLPENFDVGERPSADVSV